MDFLFLLILEESSMFSGKVKEHMKSFWLFRTNLKQLEYYHDYTFFNTSIEQFKQKCHDFYILQGIWFLENDIFDEFIVWRLAPSGGSYPTQISYEVNGKRFIQNFVDRFEGLFGAKSPPHTTFFRGGFPEYGKLTRMRPDFFGLKLYCGTGQRVQPQHGGIYDKILVEDDRDLGKGAIPFYKTANPNIFKPLTMEQQYDICWPCNFSQLTYKGQEWFIKEVGKSTYLKGLKILHVGNKPEVGKELCKKYKVSNIEFAGHVSRPDLNALLNYSKLGLVTSNLNDGCPRIITEILCAGIPLLVRDETRLLDYYGYDGLDSIDKQTHVRTLEGSFTSIDGNIMSMINYWIDKKKSAYEDLDRLSMTNICNRNLAQWGMV